MIKQKLFLLFLMMISLSWSQTNVVTGMGLNTRAMVANGSIIYVSAQNDKTIYKVDVSQTTPVKEAWVTGLDSPAQIAIKDNFLYILEYQQGKVVKVDMNESVPTKTDVITNINYPFSLDFNGNELYVGEYFSGNIIKFDVTHPNPTVSTVLNVPYPFALKFYGNDLYISENNGNILVKANITQPSPTKSTVLTGLDFVEGLKIYGNDMYLAGSSAYGVKKFDITEPSPNVAVLTTLPARSMVITPEDTFFVNSGNLFKDATLSIATESIAVNNSPRIHPNPTLDQIQISSSMMINKCAIYNMIGQKVAEFKGIKYNAANLPSGAYLMQLYAEETVFTEKFVKK